MEKLIELLNEYDEGGNWRKLHWKGLGCEDHDTIGYKDKELSCEQDEIIAYLISKEYGFIKWLVDNNKIDNTALQKYWDRWEMGMGVFSNMYNSDIVILTLSIQDEPIKFLCSILK